MTPPDLSLALYTYAARMTRVVDGDTYEMEIDLGFRTWIKVPVRVYRFYAPELHQPDGVTANPAGEASRDAAAALFAKAKTITVHSRKAESYQRVLADVYLDGHSIADLLVAQGQGTRTP